MRTAQKLLMIMTARGGSAWTPLNLGSTLKGWWDFSDPTTLFTDAGTTLVSADGQAIYQASDKSGQNNHLRQATEAGRPTYKVGITNGNSVARFDGIGDSLVSIANHPLPGAQHYLIALVMSPDNAATRGMFSGGAGTVNKHLAVLWNASYVVTQSWFASDLATAGSFIATTTPAILFFEWDGTTRRTYKNGGTPVSGAAAGKNTTESAWTLGVYNPGGYYLDGDVHEHLLCDDDLSVANKNLLGSYLADKWGITWTAVT